GDGFIIQSGTPDGNGRVNQTTGTTQKITDFIIPAARVKKLHDAKKILFATRMWTTHFSNAENIRIYTDYTILIHLCVRVDIDVSSSDDISF
ncbi:MAG: hypothetical protein KJ607_08685, partial [Bacteroidetes bacterium]|nr:hypothetical protein [Bacteroidota bacterium]